MQHPIFFELTILFLIFFYSFTKPYSFFENSFIFIILELLISSYFSVLYVNTEVWEVNKNTALFVMFRIYEIIILPILILLFINILKLIPRKWLKGITFIIFLLVTYGVEYTLVHWDIITYIEWVYWKSILIYILLFISVMLLLKFFQRLFQKERIIS